MAAARLFERLGGVASRREVKLLVEQRGVLVNGRLAEHFRQPVDAGDEVSLTASAEARLGSRRTILLHKPMGIVSGQPEPGKTPAVKLLTSRRHQGDAAELEALPRVWQNPARLRRLGVCGRLDENSTGLLVFTQNGALARAILDGGVEKEYLVRLSRLPTDAEIGRLSAGGLLLPGDERPLLPALVEPVNEDQVRVVLTEGRNRQIRRMVQEVMGLDDALAIKRVRVGRMTLGNLRRGKWRLWGVGEGSGV